jgi:carbon starvation protein
MGSVYAQIKDSSWMPGVVITSAIICCTWGYLLYTGDISSIWPLFGATNQALSSLALAVGTTMILKISQKKVYALTTALPCLFTFCTTIGACVMNIQTYFAKGLLLNAWISIAIVVMILLVIADNVRTWVPLLKTKSPIGLCCT